MNIWLINHYAVPPNRIGGSRHYSFAKELIRRGHQVTVIASSFDHGSRTDTTLSPGETGKLETIGGVPFLLLRSLPYGGTARRFANMIDFARRVDYGRDRRQLPKPDIVIGSSLTLFAALAGLFVARRERVPFVLEIRDVWPATLIDFGMSRWHPGIWLFAVIEKYLYRNSDAIISLLPGAVEHIRTDGGGDKRIEYIPNGVDFSVVPDPEPPVKSDVFRLVFAGSYVQGNCLSTLLDAAELLRDRGRTDIEIHLIGYGSEKASFVANATQRGLTNVIFHDPVPKAQIWPELAKADGFVALLQDVPLYRFGMSLNKLFDYMGSARPIVFAGKSCNDPVSESGCGFSVAAEDEAGVAGAIERLAALRTDERWNMGLRGRKYVEENHDFRKLSDKLESLLGDLAGRQAELSADELILDH